MRNKFFTLFALVTFIAVGLSAFGVEDVEITDHSAALAHGKLFNYGGYVHLLNKQASLSTYDVSLEALSQADTEAHQTFVVRDLWTLGTVWGHGWYRGFVDNYSPHPTGYDTPPNNAMTLYNRVNPELTGNSMMGAWIESQNYSQSNAITNIGAQILASDAERSEVLGTDGELYSCIANHTSSSSNRPITGGGWSQYWCKAGTEGCTNGGGNEAWVSSTTYKASGTGRGMLFGIVGSAISYGTPSLMNSVVGELRYQGNNYDPDGVYSAFNSRIDLYAADGVTPQSEGRATAYYANPINGGRYKQSFYGTDRLVIDRTTAPVESFDSAAFIQYRTAGIDPYVTPAIYARLSNTGSAADPNGGHMMGILSIVDDTPTSKFYLFGLEGRVNAYGSAFMYAGELGYTQWMDSAERSGSPPIMVLGVMGRAECIEADGSPSSDPIMCAAFYANPVVGGLLKYSFIGNDPVRLNGVGGSVAYTGTSRSATSFTVTGCIQATVENVGNVCIPYGPY